MSVVQRPVVPGVLTQHAEDAAFLRHTRTLLLRAPHVKLKDLTRADERLAAHLDGVSIAGEAGTALSMAALETPGVGQLFVATVLAIERRDGAMLSRMLALLDIVPDAARALSSAFGWVSPALLKGLTAPLLGTDSPDARWLGIAACRQHRVDPGSSLVAALEHADTRLRTQALRAAGELGRVNLLPQCLVNLSDEHVELRFHAARSALLLGDRAEAYATMAALGSTPGPLQLNALALALFAASPESARGLVKQVVASKQSLRVLIKAAGWAGDPQVIPWLLKHMDDKANARLAGEAFSFITGIDLAMERMQMEAPAVDAWTASAGWAPGPSDDPDDDAVALDEDENLPWPDVGKLRAWWVVHAASYPSGARFFAGAPVGAANCHTVLKEHAQRRRSAAALHMSLMQPGAILFNCAAPARRQSRLLAQMEA